MSQISLVRTMKPRNDTGYAIKQELKPEDEIPEILWKMFTDTKKCGQVPHQYFFVDLSRSDTIQDEEGISETAVKQLYSAAGCWNKDYLQYSVKWLQLSISPVQSCWCHVNSTVCIYLKGILFKRILCWLNVEKSNLTLYVLHETIHQFNHRKNQSAL